MKKNVRLFFTALVAVALLAACNTRSGNPRVLVFTKTAGFHHASIPAGIAAIEKLGAENSFEVDTTSNAAYFTEDSLKKYAAVIFLHTTGDLLNGYQEADFERYIQAGGGFVGVHAAADAEYDWGWYGRLVGGYFESHPEQQEATLNIVDAADPSTKHLPNPWKRKDEWYNYKNLSKDVHVLIKIDEKSYKGGNNGDNHPMAWFHEFDGGRAWYTELGHTDESFSDPNYLKHLLAGIQYGIGGNKNLDYAKAKTLRVPEEDRFTKTTLAQGMFFEPTEMTVLPNLDILVIQRRGEVLRYDHEKKDVKQVGYLNVYWKTVHTPNVNAEEGLLGLQKDPDFAKNHYIYMYYSPSDTSVNRLSRFTFENDTINPASEKIVLQVYSQREICCHTGGSIAFGKDRMLYLSLGDNSTPFDESGQKFVSHGYAPLDDRPGHEQYDARRTSGNTNDLRGKIIRIKVNEDGTYTIPDGNLFPKGTQGARPEIYVMGNRNPYRISVDQKNGNLYWGEVGPDANVDSFDTRGPRGYDEVNQARKAGYFGWPLFVGNNYPYYAYDYGTGTSGKKFDPARPVNESRNNTGLKDLPPAQPAFIWYPYADSKDFPQVGTGGRNAMAGPVYYTDMYPKETRLPDYYNGKLIIYEWIRGWMKAVTMKENGDFDKMEPFMEHNKNNNLIDLEVGPDGRLYMLEYGSGWFAKNPDAGLSRIDYNAGNRAPRVSNLAVDKTSGSLPLSVNVSVEAMDPEKDELTYIWHLNGETKETKEPKLAQQFDKPGDYSIFVEVKDKDGATTKSNATSVYAGNEAPVVTINVEGNKTFYFPGQQVKYNVSIDDKDDTAKTKNLENLVVAADYIEGKDLAAKPMGHQVVSETVMGKNLMMSLDCKTCHKVDEKSIGPSFQAVADRYAKDGDATTYLVEKIIKGGAGKWGEVAMAAHPDLKETDARQIVGWIRSLAAGKQKKPGLPAAGSINPTLGNPVKPNGVLYLTATYTDNGGNNIKPLSGGNAIALRSNNYTFDNVTQTKDFTLNFFNGMAYMMSPKNTGWFAMENIDLTGVKNAELNIAWTNQPVSAYTFELRLDGEAGTKLGEFAFEGIATQLSSQKPSLKTVRTGVQAVTDGKMHTLYLVAKSKNAAIPNDVILLSIRFDNK